MRTIVAALVVRRPALTGRPARRARPSRRRSTRSQATPTRSRRHGASSVRAAPIATAWTRGASAGPDLTQVWASGRTDEGLFQYAHDAACPAPRCRRSARAPPTTSLEDPRVLETIAAPAATDADAGNAENGERVFRAQCAGCHRVNGTGGRLGPDLSRIGVSRARAAHRRADARRDEDFLDGYKPVIITPTRARRSAASKQERRSLLRPDHGRPRAHPGLPRRTFARSSTESARRCRCSARTA